MTNKPLYYFLQWTWGIVQNLAGFLIFLVLTAVNPRRARQSFSGATVIKWRLRSSMGLGMFIFLSDRAFLPQPLLVHEFGHTLQSIILGPLFIPVIGIPSLLWASLPVFEKLRTEKNISYFAPYFEKWANRLGQRATSLTPPA